MSRLAPALRVRRRELDRLALAITRERQHGDLVSATADDLAGQRQDERRLASVAVLHSDPWFAACAGRLTDLAKERAASEQRLQVLRHDALQARARLSLLEQADHAARAAERRRRDKAAQAALDDRTAARRGHSP